MTSPSPSATPTEPEILCPFCNGKIEPEMYNGTYGCDTGCDYVRFEVYCPHCRRLNYQTGCFGEFGDPGNEDDDYLPSAKHYRDQFMAEFAEAVVKINARRAAQEAEAAADD